MKFINGIALLLASVGAINWGLIGIFDFNLVTFLFGSGSFLTTVTYVLIGICGIYSLCLIPQVTHSDY